MFTKLQEKWKISGIRFFLVLLTFAIGGSLCGYTARMLLRYADIDNRAAWLVAYIFILTVLWPLCVLIVSLPLGQFYFFKKYLLNIFSRIARRKKLPARLAIFASGAGSNAQKIIDFFKLHSGIEVALIVCNRPGAGVIVIAEANQIPVLMIDKEAFFNTTIYINELKKHGITWIVLAGFLWKVPAALIQAFPDKIINIHPALLPKYGGKGMYGQRVHEAVVRNKETESGISIHFVDEHYDHGQVVMQASCPVLPDDDARSLAAKIHALEHRHFAPTIKRIIEEHAKSSLKKRN